MSCKTRAGASSPSRRRLPDELRASTLVILVLLGLAGPLAAHNGAVALAYPVSGITVDGDLSDWPSGLTRYPIVRPEYGEPPHGADDLTAVMRVGYDISAHALFVAVEVRDESIVISDEVVRGGGGWNSQDGCDLYLDVAHADNESPASQYVLWGRSKEYFVEGAETHHNAIEIEVERGQNIHCYEWRVDLGVLDLPLLADGERRTLAFDVIVGDKDADDSFSWMAWGKGAGKVWSTLRRGDLVLMAGRASSGTLRGRLHWRGTGEALRRGHARLHAAEGDFHVDVVADTAGVFAQALPVGAYTVRVAGQRAGEEAQVTADAQVDLTVPVAAITGEVSEAGSGDLQPSGSGVRRGLWHTFSTLDGLPSPNVQAIFQDKDGGLWFGTERGVMGAVSVRLPHAMACWSTTSGPLRKTPTGICGSVPVIGARSATTDSV